MSVERIEALSDEAFALARRVAGERVQDGDRQEAAQKEAARKEAARKEAARIARELTALRAELDGLPPDHTGQGARVAFSEGFLDLDWVMSGGRTPTSIRMAVTLRGAGGPARPPD